MSLTKMQQEYLLHCNRRWNVKTGATGSGKSWLDYAYVIPKRIMCTRNEGLIVLLGTTQATILRNIIEPMRTYYGERMVGAVRNDNSIQLFGKKCYILGADSSYSVSKIQGATIEYAYGDEVATWSQKVFEMLKSRLRCEHSTFDGTCNPEGPDHWFKKFIDSDADIFKQDYVIDDNPYLPQDFVKSLKNEYKGTVYYDRYILGKWALAEGLIFPMYQEAIGQAPEDARFDKYVVSIDYGTENAFAALLWARDERTNIWYGRKEYYYSGRTTGIAKTDDEYADDLEDFLAPIFEEYDKQYMMRLEDGDPFAVREKILTIIDPSAASFIVTLQRRKKFKVQKAVNDVLDGIRETAVAMKKGLIKIDPGMKNTLDELGRYVWDEKSAEVGQDKPLKVNDHACDATRYFVKTMHIVQRGMKQKSISDTE